MGINDLVTALWNFVVIPCIIPRVHFYMYLHRAEPDVKPQNQLSYRVTLPSLLLPNVWFSLGFFVLLTSYPDPG